MKKNEVGRRNILFGEQQKLMWSHVMKRAADYQTQASKAYTNVFFFFHKSGKDQQTKEQTITSDNIFSPTQ